MITRDDVEAFKHLASRFGPGDLQQLAAKLQAAFEQKESVEVDTPFVT